MNDYNNAFKTHSLLTSLVKAIESYYKLLNVDSFIRSIKYTCSARHIRITAVGLILAFKTVVLYAQSIMIWSTV